MNQEQQFAAVIEDIVKLGRSQGNVISKVQLEEMLSEVGVETEQLVHVYEYLKSVKIGVDEQVNLDEYLTKDESDYLQMYKESLAELPQLTDGEKKACMISAMAGMEDAKKQLIEIMLPDIVDMAKLYSGQGVMVEDLIGEGNIALTLGVEMLGALESADEVPGTLAQMAMNAMEEIIAQEAEEHKTDEKMADKVNKVTDAAKALAEELGRKITVDELAEECNLSRKMIEDAIRLSGERIQYFEGSKD